MRGGGRGRGRSLSGCTGGDLAGGICAESTGGRKGRRAGGVQRNISGEDGGRERDGDGGGVAPEGSTGWSGLSGEQCSDAAGAAGRTDGAGANAGDAGGVLCGCGAAASGDRLV